MKSFKEFLKENYYPPGMEDWIAAHKDEFEKAYEGDYETELAKAAWHKYHLDRRNKTSDDLS